MIDKSNNMVVVLNKIGPSDTTYWSQLLRSQTLSAPMMIHLSYVFMYTTTKNKWHIYTCHIDPVYQKERYQNLALPSPLWPKNTPRSWHLPFLSKLSSAPAWLPWDEMQTIHLTLCLSTKKAREKLGRKDTRGWTQNSYTFRGKDSPASPIIFPPWIYGPPWPHGWIVRPSVVVATSVQPDGWQIDIQISQAKGGLWNDVNPGWFILLVVQKSEDSWGTGSLSLFLTKVLLTSQGAERRMSEPSTVVIPCQKKSDLS